MNDLTDQQLLRDYAERRSEAAFTELVRRHVDVVHSAAGRMTGDAHSAEDVTQAVFLALAHNAARLSRHPVLSGWLHTTARHLAAKTVRAATRRQFREQEAAAMNLSSSTEKDPPWADVAPHLDAALGDLNEAERDAVLLRYFEKKSAPEIAALLGTSPAAAQKRVTRAVERLRESFSRRGVTIGAAGLALVIGAHAVQASPAGFATTISSATLAASAVPASTAIATTKAIAMTTIQKTVVTITLATFAGAGVYEAHQAQQLRTQNRALKQQQASMAQPFLPAPNAGDDTANGLANLREENEQLKSNQTELLKLRGEVAALRSETTDADKKAKTAEQKLAAIESSASLFMAHEAATINAGKMMSLQFRVFADTNDNQFPTPAQFVNGQREGGPFRIGVEGIGAFEYINPGAGWREHPNTVVLRQRIAQQTVNGTWERIYAFADGSVQTALSNDGNFDAWEKINTYQAGTNQ